MQSVHCMPDNGNLLHTIRDARMRFVRRSTEPIIMSQKHELQMLLDQNNMGQLIKILFDT